MCELKRILNYILNEEQLNKDLMKGLDFNMLKLNSQSKENQSDSSLNQSWKDLFLDYFITREDKDHDDMLFFVKELPWGEHNEAVFVRRKPEDNTLPVMDIPVLWRETFFLNLIVQLNCKLRVSICKRHNPNNGNTGSANVNKSNNIQRTLKLSIKRVYALPSRSRLDNKESSYECSYPLIYYAVEDHDDMFNSLILGEGEHLCVELLGCLAEGSELSLELIPSHTSADSNITLLPKGGADTIPLFRGSANFQSLLTALRHKLALKPSRKGKSSNGVNPTPEYIIMRGPEGKGHAQVALTTIPIPFSVDKHMPRNSDPNATISSTASSSFLQSLKRLSLSPLLDKKSNEEIEIELEPDPQLACSITYVNIPWTTIIDQLIQSINKMEEKT